MSAEEDAVGTDPINPTAAARRNSERSQQQRARILDAAQHCFIESGFHAAGMASIAARAEMSPGLIYRYFESKSAIILSIIERQLLEKQASISTLKSGPELSLRICELFRAWQRGDDTVMNAALFLEMSAEATRDPEIAKALARADRASSRQFQQWVEQHAPVPGAAAADGDLSERILIFQCFIEGLAIRAVRDPKFDAAIVAAAVQHLVRALVHDAGAEPEPQGDR